MCLFGQPTFTMRACCGFVYRCDMELQSASAIPAQSALRNFIASDPVRYKTSGTLIVSQRAHSNAPILGLSDCASEGQTARLLMAGAGCCNILRSRLATSVWDRHCSLLARDWRAAPKGSPRYTANVNATSSLSFSCILHAYMRPSGTYSHMVYEYFDKPKLFNASRKYTSSVIFSCLSTQHGATFRAAFQDVGRSCH